MSRRLRGEFYFRISDLLTAPDQLGRAFVLRLPSARAEVVLPRSNDDASFRLSKRTDAEEFDDHVRIEHLVVEDHDDIQAVRTLKVVVRLEHGGDDEEAWKDTRRVAEKALRRFVDWVRIETAQAAITAGPEAIRPLRDSVLIDEATGARLVPLTETRVPDDHPSLSARPPPAGPRRRRCRRRRPRRAAADRRQAACRRTPRALVRRAGGRRQGARPDGLGP